MPRVGRTVLAYYPHHIIQRGHNRQVVFAEPRDFERYIGTMAEFKAVYGVKIYAWNSASEKKGTDLFSRSERFLQFEVNKSVPFSSVDARQDLCELWSGRIV